MPEMLKDKRKIIKILILCWFWFNAFKSNKDTANHYTCNFFYAYFYTSATSNYKRNRFIVRHLSTICLTQTIFDPKYI